MDSKNSNKKINQNKNKININVNNNKNNNKNNNSEINNNQSNQNLNLKQKISCSDNNSNNYYNAYKSMIFMNKITIEKNTFNAFLVKIKTIPNFIKLIEKLIIDNKNENSKEIINCSFKNYQLEKKIKLYYLFEECEYIIKHNLINENAFIIVDKNFFKYLNIKINDRNKKYVTINKNKSIFSIKFQNSNKNLNFIEIKPGIYIFKKKNNNIINNSVNNKNKNIRLFDKIKSKYIIFNITSYIKDESFLLKLIKYSKHIQKKLDINIFNYQEKYLNKRFNYENFLTIFNLRESFIDEDKKKEFYDNLKEEKIKYNINNEILNKFAINYFNNYYNNLNNKEYSLYDNSKDIDLDSPFFDALLNTDFFNKIFNIIISTKVIEKLELLEEYKSKFKKINESNIEYSSLTFYIDDKNDFEILNDLNINFRQLKKLKLLSIDFYIDDINFNELVKKLNIQNNLIYFHYHLRSYYNKIDSNQIENINNFKSLKYLILSNFQISSLFELKLNNLKHLELVGCSNFTINNNNFNLVYLKLINCSNIIFSNFDFLTLNYLELEIKEKDLIKNKLGISMIKCPELNELILNNGNNFYDLDFKNLMKLKKFGGNLKDILLIKSSKQLESLIISSQDIDLESLKKLMKTLKTKEKYYSVKKLKIYLESEFKNYNLNDLINFFPNLSDLNVEYFESYGFYTCGVQPMIQPKKIIINENECSKINNIILGLYAEDEVNIELNCMPYNKIKSFYLYTDYIDIDNFPFFKSECNIVFNCLESFHFTLVEEEWVIKEKMKKEELIENLYNNIDKMPNLKDFYFNFNCKNISEKFYKNFIEKVLTLKSLKKIFISINNFAYKEKLKLDLKHFFPEKEFNKYEKVEIYKLDEYD